MGRHTATMQIPTGPPDRMKHRQATITRRHLRRVSLAWQLMAPPFPWERLRTAIVMAVELVDWARSFLET